MGCTINIVFLCFVIYNTCNLSKSEPVLKKTGDAPAATEGEFPFAVAIKYKTKENGQHFCTGSLISNKKVLTANHCILEEKISDLEVSVGNINVKRGQKYAIIANLSYPEWEKLQGKRLSKNAYTDDDITILTLDEEVKNSKAGIVEILSENIEDVKKPATFVGWGVTQPDGEPSIYLKKGQITLLDEDGCDRIFRKLFKRDMPYSFLCSDTTQYTILSGDSGGPLLDANKKLIGINLHSVLKSEPDDKQVMNLFLRLYEYREYIAAAMK